MAWLPMWDYCPSEFKISLAMFLYVEYYIAYIYHSVILKDLDILRNIFYV